jgi:ribosomal protein S18 acetylase RimI-like enzyme
MNYCGDAMTNTTNTTAVLMERSQLEIAIDVLSDAFANDPLTAYLLPDFEPKRASLRRLVCTVLLRSSLPYERIYTTPDFVKGVAAWIPPGHAPVSLMQLLKAGLYTLPLHLDWTYLSRWTGLLKWDYYHRQDMPQPHWYLMVLGVSPKYQRQGIGSLVLHPVLEQADRDGLPCYLETSTELAVTFYQRHGFEIIRAEPFSSGGPPFWTMKREPK